MAATLPPPEVPALGADNTIDLDQLGIDDLITYINHPTLKEGDFLWPTWYGCQSNGDPADMFTTLIEVGPGELEPEGKQVSIGNNLLQALDQGYVFYSFKVHDPSQPDERGEESKRRFFYVGKRPFAQALPVPHFRQSHELHVDLSWFATGPATVAAPPYKAMSVGDRVTLEADLHFDDGMFWETFRSTNTLVEADIGQPQKWLIDRGRLQSIDGGFAHLRYVIEYADPTTPTTSASQTVQIIAPPTPCCRHLASRTSAAVTWTRTYSPTASSWWSSPGQACSPATAWCCMPTATVRPSPRCSSTVRRSTAASSSCTWAMCGWRPTSVLRSACITSTPGSVRQALRSRLK